MVRHVYRCFSEHTSSSNPELEKLMGLASEELDSMANRKRVSVEAAQRISLTPSGVSGERVAIIKRLLVAAVDDIESVVWYPILASVAQLLPSEAEQLKVRLIDSLENETCSETAISKPGR